ncbi:MAG TPA: gfo/Idh/MocA family oxidoreductase [Planctomycetes bacterium]|nr:gfo/Idh/MocA family oxidoreductase [Planctomycetota bacterium]
MRRKTGIDRREFMRRGTAAGAAALAARGASGAAPAAKIKVGVIGCGSVSRKYLPHLAGCAHAELASACDIKPERAAQAAKKFKIPNHYPQIDAMLAGAPFDLLVNLTFMQEHGRLNKIALEAGKHVWSEKPLANTYAEGAALVELAKKKGVRIWGAPTVVNSPQFEFMARAINARKLGALAAAHASYGHLGPDWSAFFYEKLGGSMPDLGVYNLVTLTGLLGPARAVTAMLSVVTPMRTVGDKGEVRVEAEDNAMVLLDHGKGVISHVQCGFNYFTPFQHDDTQQDHHTISIIGREGSLHLCGYDWAPHGVDIATADSRSFTRRATGAQGYCWEQGASVICECLATGKEPRWTAEHALHVVEIMEAARESQEHGRRVALKSTFPWPVVEGV